MLNLITALASMVAAGRPPDDTADSSLSVYYQLRIQIKSPMILDRIKWQYKKTDCLREHELYTSRQKKIRQSCRPAKLLQQLKGCTLKGKKPPQHVMPD